MISDDIEIPTEPESFSDEYHSESYPIEDLSLNVAPLAPPQRQIKHIVISGGSAWGFCALGMLHEAISVGFLHISDIQTMYLTSVGSIIGTMFALGIDADILKDYIIKRPWDTVCKKNRCSFLEIYDNKGVIHRTFFDDMFSPLLKSIDLDIDATMSDIHAYNGIEIHIYVTEINTYRLLDISYRTHPDWKILDAIYASCSIPLIFAPILREHECYMDGAILLNYPIQKCIDHCMEISAPLDEILGISLGIVDDEEEKKIIIHEQSNIFDVFNVVISRFMMNNHLFWNDKIRRVPYEIFFVSQMNTLEYSLNILYSKEQREELVGRGIICMREHFASWVGEPTTPSL
jgi:predicted acylesterase/phospholipase RssA